MTTTSWTVGTLAILGVMTAAAWREVRLLERLKQPLRPTAGGDPGSEEEFLDGEVNPVATSVVAGPVERLIVMPGTWVRRGQVVGDAGAEIPTDRELALELARLGRTRREEAEAAKRLETAELTLDTAKGTDSSAGPRVAAAQAGELESVLLLDLGQNSAVHPVLAPEDGVLVALDKVAGRYGIAREPAKLVVTTHVHPSELASVRVGKRGVVWFENPPKLRMTATVSEVSPLPMDSPEGEVYEVRFLCDNPDGVQLAGVRAKVQVEGWRQ